MGRKDSQLIQILDNETIDDSFKKRYFLKIHHQQAANLKDFDQKNWIHIR